MSQSTPDQPAPEIPSESAGPPAGKPWYGWGWVRGLTAVALVFAVIAAAAYGVTRDSTPNGAAAASGSKQSASPTQQATSPAATAKAKAKAAKDQPSAPATAKAKAKKVSGAKGNASAGGTNAAKKKAKNLKATATVQDQQVAREDAAADDSDSQPQPPGVWRVGSVGTYLVGKGIGPGTYESAAPSVGKCRWARLKDLTEAPKDIIAKHATGGASVVTIKASDKFFRTSNCENWHKIA